MGSVSDKIISDAEARALEIEAGTDEKAEELREEYDLIINDVMTGHEIELKEAYSREITRLSSSHNIKLNIFLLREKRKIFENLAEEVRKRITADVDLYQKYIIRCAAGGVESGVEKIVFSEQDSSIFDENLLARINMELTSALGRSVNLTFSEKRRHTGGGFYMIENRHEFNATIDSAVDEVLDEYETEIVAMLFGEE